MCEKTTWLYFMHCHCFRGQFPWESNALLMITILLQVWSIYNLVMKNVYLFGRRYIIRSLFLYISRWQCKGNIKMLNVYEYLSSKKTIGNSIRHRCNENITFGVFLILSILFAKLFLIQFNKAWCSFKIWIIHGC